jgi:hypothetical protein
LGAVDPPSSNGALVRGTWAPAWGDYGPSRVALRCVSHGQRSPWETHRALASKAAKRPAGARSEPRTEHERSTVPPTVLVERKLLTNNVLGMKNRSAKGALVAGGVRLNPWATDHFCDWRHLSWPGRQLPG